MKIVHIAFWTKDLEAMKNFYVKYFNGTAGEKYMNSKKQFESYFISFESSARIELMYMPYIAYDKEALSNQRIGLAHLAFSAGSREAVDMLTEHLRRDGYAVMSEPRYTGDGYYESCILDPDGNQIEITE